MSMNRREFMQMLAVAAAGGMTLHSNFARAEKAAEALYDLPPFGNVSLLHILVVEKQLLTEDQLLMCRALVTDACRKALVKPSVDAFGDLTGLTQGTFSANGFSGSFQNANGSGAAYFDRDTLRALMRSLGTSQGCGTVIPSYGRL